MWIQNTGAGWLMTSLAPSPLMVSLVQAAAMLPVFLFALPGGAAADILDRRLALIAAQLWIAAMGVLLAVLGRGGRARPLGPAGADLRHRRRHRGELPRLGRRPRRSWCRARTWSAPSR
jgi:MFS family permease